jgi:hypothetical protein
VPSQLAVDRHLSIEYTNENMPKYATSILSEIYKKLYDLFLPGMLIVMNNELCMEETGNLNLPTQAKVRI